MRDGRSKFSDSRNLCRSREPRLHAAQSFLHILSLIDIDQQTIPARGVAFTVAHQLTKNVKPSVCAIAPSQTVLNLVHLTGSNGMGPCAQRRVDIVRVKEIEPALLR